MLSATITAMLDTALNAWIHLDEESPAKLQAIAGKVICMHITGLNVKLYFLPDATGIYSMTEYEGKPDVTIKAAPVSLIRLNAASDSGKAMLDSDVTIEGNMGLSEKFSDILSGVDLDWEEWLSHIAGDLVAYKTGETVRGATAWLKETNEAMQMNTSECLQEESRILPAEAEVAYYMDQVDALRGDADRLEARVKRLQKNLSNKSDDT